VWLKSKKKKLQENINIMASAESATKPKLSIPSSETLQQACKLSIKLQKAIDFYFYVDSLKGSICIATNEDDKIIYKNNEEHTSPIQNTYKVNAEYLVVTENTIYVISAKTKIK
jgi:hypothetical protein